MHRHLTTASIALYWEWPALWTWAGALVSLSLNFPTGKLTQKGTIGISLEVQWLRLHASNAGDTWSVPGQGTINETPHDAWQGKDK